MPPMRAAYILIPALGVIAIAYRFYSAFLAAKVMSLDDTRITPAHTQQDGHNFVPTHKWVLFGHHFAAIAGPGPLIGPVLAAQFGFLPGVIWLVAGVCLAGAVHDMIILWASTRRKGKSLAEIARMEIGPVAGFTAAVAILFIIVIALAGVGLVFINALADSPWGVFTIAVTIPLALFMSLYMYKLRPGQDRRSDGHWSHRTLAVGDLRPGSRDLIVGAVLHVLAHRSWCGRSESTALRRQCSRCGCCSRRATISAPS